jgi:DNA-binding transcriptional LysR family regulator
VELRQLETFAKAAELQSFTQAAEALCLTQPAVTRQIAALETELRTRLFERLGRRVQLTAAGERLHGYATEMLRLAQEAERAVGDVVTGTAGRLAVGASSTAATYVLPRLLRRFREAHPGVELSIHTGASAQVTEQVSGGEVDVGVVTGLRERTGLVEIPLAEVETGVVVYPEHPLALKHRQSAHTLSDTLRHTGNPVVRSCGEGVRAEELAGCPLILMEEGTNLRTYVDRLLSAAGVEERVTLELDNVEAIKKMIEAQLGISLLPLVSVEVEIAAGRLVALPLADVPNAHRRIAAIYRQDKYLSAALKAFLSLLKNEL